MDEREFQSAINDAIRAHLDEDEVATCWCLTIEVARADGGSHLSHRAGGGFNGTDRPKAWTALGMLQGSVAVATRQLLEQTNEPEDDDSS